MLKAGYKKYTLHFKKPSGTSRGVLTTKDSWFFYVYDEEKPEIKGVGECSLIRGLSPDNPVMIEEKLKDVVRNIDGYQFLPEDGLADFPAIRFGLETALKDLGTGGKQLLYPSDFTGNNAGIPINGLIWMGDDVFMRQQIMDKIGKGFRCIKMKIGAINFEDEMKLLKLIRKEFDENELELRVDANGAFSVEEAMDKLNRLAGLGIHSIEQPIRSGQWEEMARLCETTPIPIALDEELIGIHPVDIRKMLDNIKPQYIIIKPGLLGGIRQAEGFIKAAEKQGTGWWVTSALESNIGLNAIAQWTFTLNNPLPQGLGTGQLFVNNIPSPLHIKEAGLWYDPHRKWNLNPLFDE